MSQVCKDVGHDGQGFYCLRCGKAGFKSEASARGHLAQCRGRAISRGVPVTDAAETYQQTSLESGAGSSTVNGARIEGQLAGATPGGQSTTFLPDTVQASPGWFGDVDFRLKALENEYNHLLMEKNQTPTYHPIQQDFFSQYKGAIIIGALILFAMILSKQSGQCQVGSGNKGVGMGNIGGKALSKLVDAGISKGVSALFK